MAKDLTSKNGMIWVQPGGPNTAVTPLSCYGAGDLTDPGKTTELQRCWLPDGSGWVVTGERISPPGPVTFEVSVRPKGGLEAVESLTFPASFYFTQRSCGNADVFSNYVRAQVVTHATAGDITYTGLASMETDDEQMVTVPFEGWPPVLKIIKLRVDRFTSACTDDYNCVSLNTDQREYGECGDSLSRGTIGMVVGDSAVAPALANIEVTEDGGVTWTAAAADPFAAGSGAMSVVQFFVGRNTRRFLVAMDAPAAAQGMVAYTDDLGATWTTVNVGGAAAGDGAVYGGGLFAIDMYHIWLAGANGYIYFSEDGGQTWAAQEEGVIHAGDYNCIRFADKQYGVAAGAADVIALTEDGGETWYAATATGGGGDILACHRLDKNRIWLGDDDGSLWYSRDGGATWDERTGWEGSGTGQIAAMGWFTDHVCYMAHNTAAPVGSILFTFNGGYTWEVLEDTPSNDGFRDVKAFSERLGALCGDVSGGTSFVGRIN